MFRGRESDAFRLDFSSHCFLIDAFYFLLIMIGLKGRFIGPMLIKTKEKY